MAGALGVELSPGRCALVELTRRAGRARLKRFVTIDAGSDEPERLAGELRRMRRERSLPKRARAVVWSASSLVPTLDGDYHDRVEALRLAGFSLDATVTPPEALATLDASLERRAHAPAAYLVANPDSAALAVVRDGELLIGQELDWSALEDPRRPDRRALGRRLGAAVQRILLDAGAPGGEIDRIALCGSLPQLRALTQPLGEALGRPVEVLDTIEGVDTARLDVPLIELQKDLAGLRLAWAMADRDRPSRSGVARAWMRPVAAAGFLTAAVAATVLACWPRERAETVAPQEATRTESSQSTAVPVEPPAPPVRSDLSAPAPDEARPPLQTVTQAPVPGGARPRGAVARARPPDWRVRSILISDDRRLAIIDGRIIGPGDRIGQDTVIEIGEREVRFTDAQGRQVRVQLWEGRLGVIVR